MSSFLGPRVKNTARGTGFSEAELQAAEWARKQRDGRSSASTKRTNRDRRNIEVYEPKKSKKDKKGKKKKKKDKKEKKRSRSRSVSTASVGSRSRSRPRERSPSIPKERTNPLDSAYDRAAYDRKRERKKRERRQNKKKSWRSRSRSPRMGIDDYWDNDKFLARSESPRRQRTDGPMANTRKGAWKSRAGGVYLPPEPQDDKTDEEAEEPARYLYPEDFRRSPSRQRQRSRSPSSRGSPRYELDD